MRRASGRMKRAGELIENCVGRVVSPIDRDTLEANVPWVSNHGPPVLSCFDRTRWNCAMDRRFTDGQGASLFRGSSTRGDRPVQCRRTAKPAVEHCLFRGDFGILTAVSVIYSWVPLEPPMSAVGASNDALVTIVVEAEAEHAAFPFLGSGPLCHKVNYRSFHFGSSLWRRSGGSTPCSTP
jgi:hypothetical protein